MVIFRHPRHRTGVHTDAVTTSSGTFTAKNGSKPLSGYFTISNASDHHPIDHEQHSHRPTTPKSDAHALLPRAWPTSKRSHDHRATHASHRVILKSPIAERAAGARHPARAPQQRAARPAIGERGCFACRGWWDGYAAAASSCTRCCERDFFYGALLMPVAAVARDVRQRCDGGQLRRT